MTPDRAKTLKRLAAEADVLGAYLSAIGMLEISHQQGALLQCKAIAQDLAADVAAFTKDAQ